MPVVDVVCRTVFCVSILVFVELALDGHIGTIAHISHHAVSILVFVELALDG